jgi:Flp pilus assembly protein CpaB
MRGDINAVLAIAFGAVVSFGLTAGFMAESSDPLVRIEVRASEARQTRPRLSLPDGYQALSIRVEPGPETSGRLRAGTSVDVIVTHDDAAALESSTAPELLFQDIRVLGTRRQVVPPKDGGPARLIFFTLMVTQEQADRLTMAARNGRVHVRSAACASRTPEPEAFCR